MKITYNSTRMKQLPLAFFGKWSESNAGTGWGVSFQVANRSGMWRGGSRSELGFVGTFIPCRLQHGSWSRPKLSTVCCLRRSEVVVLKYVATLNGFMFLYNIILYVAEVAPSLRSGHHSPGSSGF